MSNTSNGAKFVLKNNATKLLLGVKDNAQYAGAEAVLTSHLGKASQSEWFLKSEQGANYLVNASAPHLCLNVAYEKKIVGASLQQWDCNGGVSELWTLTPAAGNNVLLINKNSGLAAGAGGLTEGSTIVQVERSSPLALWEVVSEVADPLRLGLAPGPADHVHIDAQTLADEMIYNIYVPIFSSTGNLHQVTQDLPRIARLGFSTILLMPIHPMGVPVGARPAVGSPYAVADFYSIDPALGHLSDFAALVDRAHSIGLKVIMDVVLNHTAWSHPFITHRPELYVHTDCRKNNSGSIAQAFWFNDVAQLDYKSSDAVQEYMATMLLWWMRNFRINGFRFDTVDNPYGKDRMIPASVWSFIGKALKASNPKAILLGECTNPELSLRPFNIDYTNYSLQPAIVNAVKQQAATALRNVVKDLKIAHPNGMLHTSIMQTWDMDLDLRMYGGPAGTLVAAVFNFTIEGVPMLFAGEEVGNDCGGVNTHTNINWNSPLANRFHTFYMHLGSLRRRYAALRRGSTTWLEISGAGTALIAFLRTWEGEQILITINFSAFLSEGNLRDLVSAEWTEVTPPGVHHPTLHRMPPYIRLGPWDFAVFTRSVSVTR